MKEPEGTTRNTYWIQFTHQHRETIQLWLDRYRSCEEGDPYRDRCIEQLLQVLAPLLRHAAVTNHRHRTELGIDVDDYLVYAEIGAYKAIVSYDPDRNDTFVAYLYTVVNNEIIKHLDREISIPASVFHNLSRAGGLDESARATCYRLLHSESLEEYESDRVRIPAPPVEEDDTERDGQLVLTSLV